MMALRWILLVVLTAGAAQGQERRVISVTGVGAVDVAPDMATITTGVQTADRRANEAMRANSALMASVMKVLQAEGIAARDVQTTGLSLFPRYDNNSASQGVRVAQYIAQNNITVRVRDLDRVGAVLDAMNQAGINQINGISFGLQNSETAMNIARKNAVTDGQEKAMLYATAAGVALGPLQSLSEPGASQPAPRPMAMARAESMAMDVPISEGELTIRARVNLVYAID